MKKYNNQTGWISRTLIILAVVMFVAILIVFFAIKFASNASKSKDGSDSNEPPKAVYETTLNDVRFLFESAEDLGSVLDGSLSTSTYQQDVVTTEKFLRVIVRAQNKGKMNLQKFNWDLGSIVDSDGRIFPPSDQVFYFLPRPDLCGEILKPEFDPVPCTRIYEVSKISTNLKIEDIAADQSGKRKSEYLDLDVR